MEWTLILFTDHRTTKMCIIQVALVLMVASAAVGYCPKDTIHSTGNCSYRIHCRGTIRGISLLPKCMEASNDPNNIYVILTDAIERFDESINTKFLAYITSLKISANWPQTQLSLLQYTTRLENLFLFGNQIERISGQPFYTLGSLENLDLSHNKLTNIDNLFRFELKPNKLKRLHLSYNRIHNISVDAFAELTSLNELDLSFNFISDLTEEPFSNLTSLEILKLNNNSIINLNGAVNNLRYLKHLHLKGNQIENIDVESLKIIIHLQTFDVSSNNLEHINSVMLSRHWPHLSDHAICKIILSGNHITSVPNATLKEINKRNVRQVTDVLTELDLSDNNISNVEYNAFQSLAKLTSLNLSKNKLIVFIVNEDDVAFVKYLNLSGNYITNLYFESFSSMGNLQNLDLSHNRLEYIPDRTFHNNYNLKHVNMTHNMIENLDKLRISIFHPDGGVLDLSNNKLSRLHIPYGEGLRLNILILQSNNITNPSLIDLWGQTDLKYLDMSYNQITELREDSLRLPNSLTSLDLSNNEIVMIAPSAFVRVKHLESLRLAHNQLRTIEYGSFRSLSSLLYLDLSFNMLSYLDSTLLMDLKSLSTLSLRYNGMQSINDEAWYGLTQDLTVSLDGNNFTCEWLAVALKNTANGYSKMHPIVQKTDYNGPSIEGIPCIPEGREMESIRQQPSLVMADERLLLTTQKILDAVRDQTFYLKKIIWRMNDNSEKLKLLP